MGWPTSNEYREALQHPLRRFCKLELKRGQAAFDLDGKPRVCPGQRVEIYEMRGAGGLERWAIGCFLEEPQGLFRRYQLINDHLHANPVTCLVETEYLDQGISIRGRWFPITRSRWIDGKPLGAFVGEHVEEPQTLRALAQEWLKMAQELRKAAIAYGNLCSDAVLVTSGPYQGDVEIRLVDYSGVYVPALKDAPPAQIGGGALQHPARQLHHTYNAEVDRFSHLAVYTALQALAGAGQTLWDRFHDGSDVLFRESDWNEPATSGVLQTLWRTSDAYVRNLTGRLILASQGKGDDLPLVEIFADSGPLSRGAVKRIDSLLGEGGMLNLTIEDEKEPTEDFGLEVEDDPLTSGITEIPTVQEVIPTVQPVAPPQLPPPIPDELLWEDPRQCAFHFEAWMPERIAVMKLQGFARDSGGEVIQSVPGHVRLQMIDDQHEAPQAPGILAWLGVVQQPATSQRVLAVVDLYLAHKNDPTRQRIGITVEMSPGEGQDPGERWRPYCDRLFCELRGYMIGTQS
jgi:hypothetical protein